MDFEAGNRRFVSASGERRQLLGFDGRPITKRTIPLLMTRSASTMKMGADVTLTSPEIRNPLLNAINFSLPYSQKILSQWIRYYDRFHPMVGNCLDLHGFFPISKFDLHLDGKDDDSILDVYENMVEETELFERFLDLSREYELIGECYPFIHWDDEKNIADAMILMNPDFINVKMHPLAYKVKPTIELEPDEMLKALVASNEPEDLEIKQQLDPVILMAVQMGQNIRIDPFNTEQIARKASPYEPRGTSIVLRIIKTLLYEDKLRDAQMAIADGLITPKIIYKLGDPANGYMPTQEDMIDFRTLLTQQAHDPLATIIYHYGLQLDMVGATGKILPLLPEFQFVEDQILTGLYSNKALTHADGPNYSNATVAMEALQGRYMGKREKLEDFTRRKLFNPIAVAHEFFEPLTPAQSEHGVRPSTKSRKLRIPKITWKQKLRLVEDVQQKQMIINLRNRDVPEVSLHKIYELLGIDFDTEMEALRNESKIRKEMAKLYGVNNPMLNNGQRPSAPGQPGMKGNSVNPPTPPKAAPEVRSPNGSGGTGLAGGTGAGGTKEPGGSMKTVEPGGSLKGASANWNSPSSMELTAERQPHVAEPSEDPLTLYSQGGKLPELKADPNL